MIHSWVLAMGREDVATSWSHAAEWGLTLPWLTVLWQMGDHYVPLLERTGPRAWPLVLLAGLVIAALWRPVRTRRGGKSPAEDGESGR